MLKKFEIYLLCEKNVSSSYSYWCCRIAQKFLNWRFGTLPVLLRQLKPYDITAFILFCAQKDLPKRTQSMASAFRAFLRFLFIKCNAKNFTNLVPAVASWPQGQMPTHLSIIEIKKLMSNCNRRAQKGLQNYTIFRLLYLLGLRASEVAKLTLDDIDWDAGEIYIHGKGSRLCKMPLSQDLGNDLVSYILRGRPICDSTNLFLSSRMQAMTSGAISKRVSAALKSTGLYRKGKAAHLLRQSLATHLLQKGATMQQISEVLRHRCIETTQIYAKVDFKRLRSLASPWPQEWNFGGEYEID